MCDEFRLLCAFLGRNLFSQQVFNSQPAVKVQKQSCVAKVTCRRSKFFHNVQKEWLDFVY